MGIEDIGGTSFGDLSYYTQLTATDQDDAALQQLNQLIMEAMPEGVTADQVGKKIDELIKAHPNWSMDKVFEEAVKSLNPDNFDPGKIKSIKDAWESFTKISDLSKDDISSILTDPAQFYFEEVGINRVVDIMAVLMALIIELAGEESANMLQESFDKRDEIMELAQQKASEMRTKAIVNCVLQCVAATITAIGACIQIGFACGAAYSAGRASAPSEAKNLPKADIKIDYSTTLNAMGQAMSSLGQSGSGFLNAIAGMVAGFIDGSIAEIDGEQQVANIHKETANTLRQKATELINALFAIIKAMTDADYQTMTNIGRA